MKERKTQLTGGSTYTVSLPKEWAKDIGLETGDPLRLYPRRSRLIIELPEADDERMETTVEVGGYPEREVRRLVLAFYTSGYSSITFTAQAGFEDNRRVIAGTARKLIGLEIIEAAETRVTVKNLLDSATVSPAQSTEQIKQVTLSMHEDAVTALLEQDPTLADHVIERDERTDRLYAMVSRHFQRSLDDIGNTEQAELTQSELYDYQTTARQFERIADHAEKIAALATRFESPPAPEFANQIEDLAARARSIVAEAASTVLDDGATDTAHHALDQRNELISEITELERDLHEQEIPQSHLIALTLDSLTRTAEHGGNIAEISLNAAARRDQL